MMQTETRPDGWDTDLPQQRFLSDLVTDYLQQLNVEFVFGVPGGAIEPFFDALARSDRRGGPRVIVSRHETGAGFMADGYHSFSGRLGVCCSTTGPGVTNLITGVASAYANQIPLMVITAQTALANFGKGALQESSCTGIDTLSMMQPCTRFNTLISHPNQLERKLANAVATAFGPIPGPVHLSVPSDIWSAPVEVAAPQYFLPNLIPAPNHPIPALVARAVMELQESNNIVFVLGEQCCESMGLILIAAQLLQAKIVTTPHGKGLIHASHPLYEGVIGFAGHASAAQALVADEVDCIVTIGTVLSEFATSGINLETLIETTLIHIDQNQLNFNLSPMADIQIGGSIEHTVSAIIDYLIATNTNGVTKTNGGSKTNGRTKTNGVTKTDGKKSRQHNTQQRFPKERLLLAEEINCYEDDSAPIHPARLMAELPKVLPPHTRYLADPGNSYAWAIHYLHPNERRVHGLRKRNDRLFKTSIEYSSMGWAIGSAIGAALALPKQTIACITGDGSLLMSGQEITVAIQEKLPVVFVVLNDSALGMVKHGQRLTGAEQFAYQLPTIDFVMYANAMGIQAFTIQSPSDLQQLRAIDFETLQEPILLDVQINTEAVPPIKNRTEVLKNQSTHNPSKLLLANE